MTRSALVLVSIAICLQVGTAAAQSVEQPIQSEIRVDGLFARSSAVQAGFGLSVPAGIYVRTGLVGGVGAGRHGPDGRLDFVARFSLDPFRQSRWSPYAGAGFSGRFDSDRDGGSRGYLLAYLGLEGPLPVGQIAGWVPALEVGFGGGTRIGLIVRRGINARR